jgi:glycosyltransferase involved in cell wall biosynthesis
VDPGLYPTAFCETRREAKGLDLIWIGSSSTLQGLEAQRPLWQQLGREFPGIRLRVVCDRFPDFSPLPVVAVPWSEATEADALVRADVGISWIPDDLWSRGKCGLKILQYQAAGLPVIANPVGVQSLMIEHGVSGFLAKTTDEWRAAVRALARDSELRRRMGQSGRTAVESRYAVEAWAAAFVAALGPRQSQRDFEVPSLTRSALPGRTRSPEIGRDLRQRGPATTRSRPTG